MAEETPVGVPQGEWEALQRKIFTRWVNQKLTSHRLPQIKDVVTDLGSGDTLRNLIEVLSEKEMPKAGRKPSSAFAASTHQQMENVANVLKFIWDCGVDMKLKPSADNIIKGDRRDIMALIWAMMMKYMRFDDDEDSKETLQAKDALLKWVQFHTQGYKCVAGQVVNLTKSFHNGLAFVALIHKFAPTLVPNPDTMDPTANIANLKVAFAGAEKFFGLEQYLEPKDVAKLDEKSALVYVSEYYYGINEQAKRVLAAKRISKLIAFITVNDQLRAKYRTDSESLNTHLTRAEDLLKDIATVDNTMAGARARVDRFNTYKSTEKAPITSLQIELEEVFNTLALRLSQNNRPPFKPEVTLDAFAARITSLFRSETAEPALHAELARQVQLAALNKRHTTLAEKLTLFIREKDAYVRKRVEVSSSAEARKQLKLFAAFVKERTAIHAGSFASLCEMGRKLQQEKFEHISDVTTRESSIADGFKSLETLGASKEPVLEDDLVRELLKEKVRMWVGVHKDIDQKLNKWAAEKTAYLNGIDTRKIASVQDTQLQLSLLHAHKGETADVSGGEVQRLKTLGSDIRSAAHKSQYSQWTYESPDAVLKLETAFDARLEAMATLAADKQVVLDDALLREQFKEKVQLWVGRHVKMAESLDAWSRDKLAYLQVKEVIASSAEAKYHLSLLEAFEKEKAETMEASLVGLKSLGNDIRTAKYATAHSQWVYDKPADVTALETKLDRAWATLASTSAQKKNVLDDELAKHLYAEQTRLMAREHANKHAQCSAWATEKKAFLQSPTPVASIGDALAHLSLLESYNKEKASFTGSAVASLKTLGKEILARKYQTSLSSYTYEAPQDIKAAESAIDALWSELATLGQARLDNLNKLHQIEVRKEDLRLEFADLASDTARIVNEGLLRIGTAEEQKTLCGSTLDETVNYGKQIATEDAALTAALDTKKTAYEKVAAELVSLSCTDNAYTDQSVVTLGALRAKINTAVDARKTLHAAELEVQKTNDALCKQFADCLVPLSRNVTQQTTQVLATNLTPQAQLDLVNSRLASVDADYAGVAEAKRLEQQIQQRKIVINVYTTLRVSEVEIAVSLLKQVLSRKKPYLEKVIEYTMYKGISPDQYKEMAAMFAQYDADKSGSINERELRTCLYSLGEERSKAEIARYMAEFGKGGVLSFEPFRELMVRLLGDAGNEAAMLESFQVLSLGHAAVTSEVLQKWLTPEEVKFVSTTAPQRDGGIDYTAWVADVCAR